MRRCCCIAGLLLSLLPCIVAQTENSIHSVMPLDDFFNYVSLQDVQISPDGSAVVFATRRPDWEHDRYRLDLWIARQDDIPQLLTNSGRDSDPEWSPNGQWIAFTSSREAQSEGGLHCEGDQVFVISAAGGEALPVTCEANSVHAFAWAPDSRTLYFSTREPWDKSAHANYEEQWKDVVQYREADRGDVIEKTDMAATVERAKGVAQSGVEDAHAITLATVSRVVNDIAISHDGRSVAFSTGPASHRREDIGDYEIFLLPSDGGTPRQVTRNNATESSLKWGPGDREIFFTTYGNPIGPPEDVQERTYSVDVESGRLTRWGASFPGAIGGTYSIGPSGSLIATGVIGTETAIYSQSLPSGSLEPIPVPRGSFAAFSLATSASKKVAFIHSAWGRPAEVYVADDLGHLADAKQITHFNQVFNQYELPQGRTYQWTSDDGTKIEGVLLYPPGKFGAKHLPTLTLIHGGPANTDGDQFRADWYDWSVLAAMHGYLVFRPNYRGSAAYGDSFLQQISPHIVSVPGRDILSGLDALTKEGVADPEKLAIAGYSYGGFMTNWLITQTTRFKAAMTGAGAVEHIMQWGNDDLPLEDIESLKGYPWEVPQNYQDEAAIFQMSKVKTPTHIVAGSVDSRVYVGEQFLLERALYALGVPHKLLLFPGEEHLLRNNPWHGKIKVREELGWLEKYCPAIQTPGATNAGAQ
ncbi:MAG TPA: S9 family peptidase [Terracidiphilus sp.]|jgi:dipeptidyl aminopeptidase/acylaminoacyl peptidase